VSGLLGLQPEAVARVARQLIPIHAYYADYVAQEPPRECLSVRESLGRAENSPNL
jgi:hypothetical protein